MRGFLFDGNLPTRLLFTPGLPVTHTDVLEGTPSDTDVWEYARQHDLVIVSKDADFSERIIVATPPPRVVHLRFGNMRRRDYHRFLGQIWPRIEFLAGTHKLVNVYRDRIEAVH